jgi:hypothetical protein
VPIHRATATEVRSLPLGLRRNPSSPFVCYGEDSCRVPFRWSGCSCLMGRLPVKNRSNSDRRAGNSRPFANKLSSLTSTCRLRCLCRLFDCVCTGNGHHLCLIGDDLPLKETILATRTAVTTVCVFSSSSSLYHSRVHCIKRSDINSIS